MANEKRLIPWRGSYKSMMDRCYRKTAYGYVWVYDCPKCGAKMDEEVSE